MTGRPEIWGAIRAAVGELHADAKSGGEDVGIATAQTIIDAVGATLPTGDLADGIYDTLGAYYAIPEWVVCDPVNVTEEGEEAEVEDEDEGKGKVVVTERDTVKVTTRLSDRGGVDVRIRIGRGENVKTLARIVAEGSDVRFSLLLIPQVLPWWWVTAQQNTDSSTATTTEIRQDCLFRQDFA